MSCVSIVRTLPPQDRLAVVPVREAEPSRHGFAFGIAEAAPEQHLGTAKAREMQAKAEKNLERREVLYQSARQHRLVAKAAHFAQAKKRTTESLPDAQNVGRLQGAPFDEAFDQALDDIFGSDTGAEGKGGTVVLGAERTTNANLGYQTAVTPTLRVAALVVPVKETDQSRFLLQVERKFRDLLSQCLDPQAEIASAAQRMENADLLYQHPDPSASPRQAAFEMFGDNEALWEIWMDWQTMGTWQGAETPEELISTLLPSRER